MDAISFDIIKSKSLKIDALMLDLNKELETATSFLKHINNHSLQLIDNMNSAKLPCLYLEQFIEVNSTLLNYISLLSEINCKFEIIQLSKIKNVDTNKSSIDCAELSRTVSCYPSYISSNSCNSSEEKYSKLNPLFKSNKIETDVMLEKFNVNTVSNGIDDSASKYLGCRNDNSACENLKNQVKCLQFTKSFENKSMTPQSLADTTNKTNLLYENPKYFKEVNLSEFSNEEAIDKEDKFKVLPDVENCNISNSSQEFSSTHQKISDKNTDTNICNKKPENTKLICEEKEENEKSFKMEVENILLKIGIEYDVTVEYIQSPSEFYVNIFTNKFHLYEELQNTLKEIPGDFQEMKNKKNSIKKESRSKKLDSDVIYYSACEESWFRARVIDWNLKFDDELVSIFLVDTGESKCVHSKFIQSMPRRLKEFPIFTRKCHLYNVMPMTVKDCSTSYSWMNCICEKMKYWIVTTKQIKIEIAPMDPFCPTSSIPVILWLVDKNKSVNELLISYDFAKKYVDTDSARFSFNNYEKSKIKNDQLESWNPMKEDFESYSNTYNLKVNDPAVVIYGYAGNDYKRVCRQFAQKGFCYKGKFCWKDHEVLNPFGYTTDEEQIFKNAYNSLPTVSLGEICSIEITCILNTTQFYCILVNSNLRTDVETMLTLKPFMNNPQNVSEMRKLTVPPAPGQVVIAKYSGDNAWYRAKVLESVPEDDIYNVIFLDYGNTEKKPLSCIRAIEPRYLHLPFQAVKCNINGIEPNLNCGEEEVREYLEKNFEGKSFKIKVISIFPGDFLSLLVDLYDDEGNDIGKDLIHMNFAVAKNEIIINHNDEILPG